MGVVAIYSGTFDPITNGHTYIVGRASQMFEHVILAVAKSTPKNTAFELDQRLELAAEVLAPYTNVVVKSFDGLIVDFCKANNATVIVRGIRSVTDFDYERQMAGMNRLMVPTIDTVFLSADEGTAHISSTLVRQIAQLGGDIVQFVHPAIDAAMRKRFA